jgi:transcriptional regulator with XRE-family HTH domain
MHVPFNSVRDMHINQAFGIALKQIRKDRNKTQEDFGIASSRTYVSTLERGLKSITIEKLEDLANVLEIHPMTLLAHAYIVKDDACDINQLFDRLISELKIESK